MKKDFCLKKDFRITRILINRFRELNPKNNSVVTTSLQNNSYIWEHF